MATYPAKVIRPIVGNVYEAIDGSLYGYSGEVSFDVSASATYLLMRFNLTQDAKFKMQFFADYDALDAGGDAIGFIINIDGIDVIRWADSITGTAMASNQIDFYVPENAEVIINLLNPDNSATICRANMVLNGKYLNKSEGNASAGVQVGDNALPPMIANRERYMNWNKELF